MATNSLNEQRPRRKAGRTLLVSNENTDELSFEGLKDTHKTDSGSRFLVFDTVDSARSAYKTLRENGVRTKYCYYKVFFRLKDIELENMQYDSLKEQVISLANSIDDTNVLYFKFYTRNKTLMGSGDLTVDTKLGLDNLVSSKELNFNNGNACFYRFKVKSGKQNIEETNVDMLP